MKGFWFMDGVTFADSVVIAGKLRRIFEAEAGLDTATLEKLC
jgi:hypothetical protein